jgi:hypothetical protein
MKYLKNRRIKLLIIKIAGLEEEVRILALITDGDHRSYDRENLINSSIKLAKLRKELELLTK